MRTVDEILRVVFNAGSSSKILEFEANRTEVRNEVLAQAKLALKELVESKKKDIPYGDTTRYIGSPLQVGYNQAISQIAEMFGGTDA